MWKELVRVVECSRFIIRIRSRKDDPDRDAPHQTAPRGDEWEHPFKRFEAGHRIRAKREFGIVLRHKRQVRHQTALALVLANVAYSA